MYCLKTLCFVIFQGGGGSGPGSAHVIHDILVLTTCDKDSCASVHSQYSIDGQASPLLC